MGRVTILSSRFGGSAHQAGRGGSEQRAIEANVSMITLIQELQDERRPESAENAEQGDHQADINGELKLNEALDVLVERPSPLHGLNYGCKRIVQKNDLAGLFGHFGPRLPHRQADVGFLERGSVIGAISGDRHHFAQLLQQPDQTVFIQWLCSRHHSKARQLRLECFIVKRVELRTCQGNAISFQQADLRGDRLSGLDVIARDHPHADSGAAAARQGCWNVFSDWFAYGDVAHKDPASSNDSLLAASSSWAMVAGTDA